LERVAQVLKYCRNWNTHAHNALIAMMMVKAIVVESPDCQPSLELAISI
jgi:hypothetical protein